MLEFNASITKHKNRIWCAYRTDHLYQFDSKSFLTEFSPDLEPISIWRLIAGNGNTAFEDVRLFSTGECILAFYRYFPQNESGGWEWKYGVGMGIG